MIELNAQTASEFDFIIGLDKSGSMGFPVRAGSTTTRWAYAQEVIFGIANELGQYDQDGIDVLTYSGVGADGVVLHEGVTAVKVAEIFRDQPNGRTPTAEALAKVVEKQKRTGRNTVAIFFTDGEPNDAEAVEKVLIEGANGIERDEQLTVLFVQIGDDEGATKFLTHLDDGLEAKGAKFDIVDTIKADEAEKLTVLQLITKAIND